MHSAFLALVATQLLFDPGHTDRTRNRTERYYRVGGYNPIPGYLFEFAPTNGAGMGSVCACTVPTGSKGEIVTFSRSSSAYCTKGPEWSGIANGDLVLCSNDQPLIMPGGDGTGPLGILSEDVGTNLVLRSQEFDNATWADFTAGAGSAATKGAANSDTAPDGTATAERVTFNATGAADSSGLSQTVFSATAETGSIYARGNATTASGTFDVCIDTAGAATCAACSYVLGSWTRCYLENITSKASGKFYIGNLSSLNGGTTRSQQTPTLWGAQGEAKAIVTSYMPSTGSAGARAVDAFDVAVTLPVPVSGKLSIGGTFVTGPSNFSGESFWTFTLTPANSNNSFSAVWGTTFNFNFRVGAVTNNVQPAATPTALASNRLLMTYDGVNVAGCLNGACTLAAKSFMPFSGVAHFYIGSRGTTTTTFHANRVMKELCYDTSTDRCR